MRRKPDWSQYPENGTYPLWVLCAISCDIEPEDIDLQNDRDDPELAEFWRRLDAAMAAAKSGELHSCPRAEA